MEVDYYCSQTEGQWSGVGKKWSMVGGQGGNGKDLERHCFAENFAAIVAAAAVAAAVAVGI